CERPGYLALQDAFERNLFPRGRGAREPQDGHGGQRDGEPAQRNEAGHGTLHRSAMGWRDISPARRPSAGAVPGRWGASFAVRTPPAAFASIKLYQSKPITSPSAGLTAFHQVSPLRLGASVRTLPSARPTSMPLP